MTPELLHGASITLSKSNNYIDFLDACVDRGFSQLEALIILEELLDYLDSVKKSEV